jgi:hypothetical protein
LAGESIIQGRFFRQVGFPVSQVLLNTKKQGRAWPDACTALYFYIYKCYSVADSITVTPR